MAGGGANSGVGSGLSTAAGAVYVLGGLALGETGSGAVQGAIAAAAAPAAIAGQCWRFVLGPRLHSLQCLLLVLVVATVPSLCLLSGRLLRAPGDVPVAGPFTEASPTARTLDHARGK